MLLSFLLTTHQISNLAPLSSVLVTMTPLPPPPPWALHPPHVRPSHRSSAITTWRHQLPLAVATHPRYHQTSPAVVADTRRHRQRRRAGRQPLRPASRRRGAAAGPTRRPVGGPSAIRYSTDLVTEAGRPARRGVLHSDTIPPAAASRYRRPHPRDGAAWRQTHTPYT